MRTVASPKAAKGVSARCTTPRCGRAAFARGLCQACLGYIRRWKDRQAECPKPSRLRAILGSRAPLLSPQEAGRRAALASAAAKLARRCCEATDKPLAPAATKPDSMIDCFDCAYSFPPDADPSDRCPKCGGFARTERMLPGAQLARLTGLERMARQVMGLPEGDDPEDDGDGEDRE